MSARTLKNSIVKKKWGYEYLAYRNKHLAIWFLHINGGEETSLHCHCKKNTGLIVLDGIARVSFLNNGIMLKGLDKVQIFKGRFHSTRAISEQGAKILEIESPEDKHDLVRLKDKYGRAGKPYEGKKNFYPKNRHCLELKTGLNGPHSNCIFEIVKVKNKKELVGYGFETTFVILDGGVVAGKKLVSGPGDVIASHNLDIILETLDIKKGTEVLKIYRNPI